MPSYAWKPGSWKGGALKVGSWGPETPTSAGTLFALAVTGNGNAILDGDASPTTAKFTDFGTVVQGGSAVSRTFIFQNTGSGTLTFSDISAATGWTITTNLPGTLAVGASAPLVLRFDVVTPGTKSGDFFLTVDELSDPNYNFALLGVVTTAVATVNADIRVVGNSVTIADGQTSAGNGDHTFFGSILLGAATTSRTYTVVNSGGTTLNILSFTAPTGFTVTEALSAVPSSGSDTFTLRLDSAVAGTKTGDVIIVTDASNVATFNFAILGNVTEPAVPALSGGSSGIRFATLDAAGLGGARKNKSVVAYGKKRRS